MRVIASTQDKLILQLGKNEKHLLLQLLKLYPRIPPAHHKLSKAGGLPDQNASEQLLEEALAEQRAENKRLLQAMLKDPQRLQENETGCRLTLSCTDLEWLLQVLNDIRVGSWVRLGSPEPKLEIKSVREATALEFWAMELAGDFQMAFLAVLRGRRDA